MIASQLAEESFFKHPSQGLLQYVVSKYKKRTGQEQGVAALRKGSEMGVGGVGSLVQRAGVMQGARGPVTLLGWTFQKIMGGGVVHSGEPWMPGHGAGRRRETGETLGEHLGSTSLPGTGSGSDQGGGLARCLVPPARRSGGAETDLLPNTTTNSNS